MSPQQIIASVIAFFVVIVLGNLLQRREAQSRSVLRRRIGGGGSDASSNRWRRLTSMVPEANQRRYSAAGFDTPLGQAGVFGGVILATMFGVCVGAWITPVVEGGLAGAVIFAFAGGALGWAVPEAWIRRRIAERRAAMIAEFPVMLDLLQISLEGGLGLASAWGVVSTHVQGASPALAGEMRRVEIELQFGGGWRSALASATERTGIRDFLLLGSLLEQSERYGTELSKSIRIHADGLRYEDLQTLEERAHRSSVKMILPLGVMLLPATLLLIAGPLIFMLLDTLSGVSAD